MEVMRLVADHESCHGDKGFCCCSERLRRLPQHMEGDSQSPAPYKRLVRSRWYAQHRQRFHTGVLL